MKLKIVHIHRPPKKKQNTNERNAQFVARLECVCRCATESMTNDISVCVMFVVTTRHTRLNKKKALSSRIGGDSLHASFFCALRLAMFSQNRRFIVVCSLALCAGWKRESDGENVGSFHCDGGGEKQRTKESDETMMSMSKSGDG
jgi:hypothetical protein